MKVYIIQTENGDREDRIKEIHWVGHNEEKALQVLEEIHASYIFFSIWEAGRCLSEYIQDSWIDDREYHKGPWERNSGEIYPYLEIRR
jgi:hypothetical protein